MAPNQLRYKPNKYKSKYTGLLHQIGRLTNMSGASVPPGLFSMPNDVDAAILDPHEPQSLTFVANNSLIKVFSDSR